MRRIVITLGSQVAIQVIGLITGVIVARLLGPVGRGEVAIVITWASVITYVGDLGLPVAYIYASAREPHRRRQLLGNALLVTPVQWAFLSLIGAAILNAALSQHGQPVIQLATFYLFAYVPLNLLGRYANSVQQGAGHHVAFNAVRLCVPGAYLACLVLLYGFDNVSVRTVVGANLLSNVVAVLLAIGLVIKLVRRPPYTNSDDKWTDSVGLVRDLRYGLAAHVGTLQPFNRMQLDVLVLSVLLPAHDLGLYVAALAGASVLKAQGYALGLVVLPELARESDRDVQRRALARFLWIAFVLSGATAGVAFVWAEPLVHLVYGTSFVAAAPILRVMVIAGVAAALYLVIGDALRGMGHPLSSTLAEIASMVVGLPALLVLVPMEGPLGAALAVAAGSSSALLMALWALGRSGFGVSDLWKFRPRSRNSGSERFAIEDTKVKKGGA